MYQARLAGLTSPSRGPMVLDGGLATELMVRGHDLSDRLWSARLLATDPDAIEAVHLAYFRAGAHVAISASYQASIEGFQAAGIARDEALELIRWSVRLAQAARATMDAEVGVDADRPRLIAGSVGPYGAMLADGSEYRGGYDTDPARLTAFHRCWPRCRAVDRARRKSRAASRRTRPDRKSVV